MPYLSKDRMSDVSNGPGGDSNSGPILAPGVYLNLTRIMALPCAIPESKRKVDQKQT